MASSYNHVSQSQSAQFNSSPAYPQSQSQHYASPPGQPSTQQPGHYPSQSYPPKQNSAPPGTFQPGTKIRVGSHSCVVERYLSEGGFAHVYVVKIDQIVDGTDIAVLKRVAVPDKEALANMRTEVDTMKRLKGHRHIVKYIDSHASHLKAGGYEVFLLMEYCAGGGLIDFMNTRLQHRLTEPEILKIFSDAAEGVACMHYLQPPLLHRDLKIENILITPEPRTYKLCDFGSSAEPRPAGTSVAECRLIEEDIQKHTTLQYRSPEMIDVFRGQPIDEKSDIWALGVLLYKLCYYTTPFEDQGQLAILNASYKYPPYPQFSSQVKGLIGSMLQEDPRKRPNIYDIIYNNATNRNKSPLPSPTPPPVTAHPSAALVKQAPTAAPKAELPQITQMRRGRPPKSDHETPRQNATSTSREPTAKVTNDPFAALDTSTNVDDISARFPPVEQFSLLHDQGARFDFGSSQPESPTVTKTDLSTRVMQKLADQAFDDMPPLASSVSQPTSVDPKQSPSSLSLPEARKIRTGTVDKASSRPIMISQGTMTSPSPSPSPLSRSVTSDRLQPKLSSQYAQSISATNTANSNSVRPSVGEHRSSSTSPYSPANLSRRSFEPPRPVSTIGSRPAPAGKPRPKSTHIESNLDFLRDLDSSSRSRYAYPPPSQKLEDNNTGRSTSSAVSDHIESSVDFLRVLQLESDASKNTKVDKRVPNSNTSGSKHKKAPSITIANPKNIFSGRLGEAFRRFEAGGNEPRKSGRSPGSQATEFPLQDPVEQQDSNLQVSSSEIPAEIRREMEKRQLQEEERRVEAAAAAYKQSIAEKGAGGRPSRSNASTIQRKVQALLSEEDRSSVPRTAEGYGRYTDSFTSKPHEALEKQLQNLSMTDSASGNELRPKTFPEPAAVNSLKNPYPRTGAEPQPSLNSTILSKQATPGSAAGPAARQQPPRPGPKPEKLRKLVPTEPRLQQLPQDSDHRLMHSDIKASPVQEISPQSFDGHDDELLEFRKRYPSLSGPEFEAAGAYARR
ncbi:Serine/threonine-protein kinase [Drechslerella dactyloides]|uniref:non-specific serine/threonine protein kinase n=1 Tax=Drechslerella dactyloides TaxID=74499 RepID=A0AAD6NHF4_DREDA|nr:Serine/threonine-protein kinase [Drechslerella dactyloides]